MSGTFSHHPTTILGKRRRTMTFPHGPEPLASWNGEPAIGARWRRIGFYRSGVIGMRRAELRWVFEVAIKPGRRESFALTLRDSTGHTARGFALYRFNGRWALALVTPRVNVRGGGDSPYTVYGTDPKDRNSDVSMMVLRP